MSPDVSCRLGWPGRCMRSQKPTADCALGVRRNTRADPLYCASVRMPRPSIYQRWQQGPVDGGRWTVDGGRWAVDGSPLGHPSDVGPDAGVCSAQATSLREGRRKRRRRRSRSARRCRRRQSRCLSTHSSAQVHALKYGTCVGRALTPGRTRNSAISARGKLQNVGILAASLAYLALFCPKAPSTQAPASKLRPTTLLLLSFHVAVSVQHQPSTPSALRYT